MDFGQNGLCVRRKVGGGSSVGKKLYEFGCLGVGVGVGGGSVGDTSDTFDALPEDFGLGSTVQASDPVLPGLVFSFLGQFVEVSNLDFEIGPVRFTGQPPVSAKRPVDKALALAEVVIGVPVILSEIPGLSLGDGKVSGFGNVGQYLVSLPLNGVGGGVR